MRDFPIGKLEKGVYLPISVATPPNAYCLPGFYAPFVEKVYVPNGLLRERVRKLAKDIFEHYAALEGELVLVSALNGAAVFFSDLAHCLQEYSLVAPALPRPALRIEFLRCSSYAGTAQTESCKITCDFTKLEESCRGRHVLVVDDLIDTGTTLRNVCRYLEKYGTLSLRVVCAISKRTKHWNGFEPDWVGFDVDDFFVIGYGMDIDEYCRDLPHVCIPNRAAITRFTQARAPAGAA